MYADLEQVGQFIECPDCFTPNPITAPRDSRKISQVAMEGGEFKYEMRDEETKPALLASHAQEIMEEAEREIEKRQVSTATTPRYPFFSGVFTYPFGGQILPVMIGMGFGLFLAVGAFKLAIDLTLQGSLVAPFAYVMAMVMLAFAVIPMSVSWLRVLEGTVHNDDDNDARPDGGLFAFLDWVGEAFYVWFAVSFSMLPIGLLSLVWTPPSDRPAWIVAIVQAGMLGFPVVLLSMLEASSPTVPLTRPILRSFREMFGSWLQFYLLASFVLSLATLSAVGMFQLIFREWTPLVVGRVIVCDLAVVMCAAIYFRLLGRLGWLLTQNIFIVDEVTEDAVVLPTHAGERIESVA